MHKPPNVEVTGAARLYRAASSDRRERGRPPGWASFRCLLHVLKELPKREAFAPNSAESDAVFRLKIIPQCLEFQRVSLPLVGVERVVDIEQLVVGIELQFLTVVERERLCEG